MLSQPHVSAVVRDSSDNVVVVAMDTGIADLGQDASAPFSIDVTVPDSTATVASVDIWSDGLENGIPTNPASAIGANVVVGTPSTFENESLTNISGVETYGGAVVNNSGTNYLGTAVNVTFVDPYSNALETEQVQPALRPFQAGTVNFFSASAPDTNTQISSATAAIATDSTLVTGATVPGDIVLSNVVAERDTDGTTLNVTGTIQNLDGNVLSEPHVSAVVRDGNGNVVVVSTDTGIPDLSPNAPAPFSIDVTVPDSTYTVSTVDFWADGLENGIPTTPASYTGAGVVVGIPTVTPTATDTDKHVDANRHRDARAVESHRDSNGHGDRFADSRSKHDADGHRHGRSDAVASNATPARGLSARRCFAFPTSRL